MTKFEHDIAEKGIRNFNLLDFIAEDSDIPELILADDITGADILMDQYEVIGFNLEIECISHNNPYTKLESNKSRHSRSKHEIYENNLQQECCKYS